MVTLWNCTGTPLRVDNSRLTIAGFGEALAIAIAVRTRRSGPDDSTNMRDADAARDVIEVCAIVELPCCSVKTAKAKGVGPDAGVMRTDPELSTGAVLEVTNLNELLPGMEYGNEDCSWPPLVTRVGDPEASRNWIEPEMVDVVGFVRTTIDDQLAPSTNCGNTAGSVFGAIERSNMGTDIIKGSP